MKAILKNYRQSPKKIRVVANALRGKRIPQAMQIISSVEKKVALPMQKLLMSAVHNAGFKGVEEAKEVSIGSITVNQGITFKRFMPRAFGRATPIRKRTSIITIELQK